MTAAVLISAVWIGVAVRGQAAQPVPFELVGNYLVVVKGAIGTFDGLNLVIDTGTFRTVVDRRVTSKLASAMSPGSMEVFGDRVAVQMAVAPSLGFGPVRSSDHTVLVADLAPQQRRFGVRIDALAGTDVLRRRCLTVDYASRRLTFDCVPPAGAPTASFAGALPVVDVSIDGQPYRLLIDSGSEAIAVFETALPGNVRIAPEARVVAEHVAGTIQLSRFTPREVRVGGHSIGRPSVYILNNQQPVAGYDGVLGARCLTNGQLLVDIPNGIVRWTPSNWRMSKR